MGKSTIVMTLICCLLAACGQSKKEEFELRTKCKELGDKLEIKEAEDIELGNYHKHNVRSHYDPSTNRCLLMDNNTVYKNGNLWSRTTDLIDAQSGKRLASSVSSHYDGGKNVGIIGDRAATYDEATKYIDKLFGDDK